jgi:hypothetical protein
MSGDIHQTEKLLPPVPPVSLHTHTCQAQWGERQAGAPLCSSQQYSCSTSMPQATYSNSLALLIHSLTTQVPMRKSWGFCTPLIDPFSRRGLEVGVTR